MGLRRIKESTATSDVEDFLTRTGNTIWTAKDIVESIPQHPAHRIMSALYMLRSFKAATYEIDVGIKWWYLTPDTDQRSKKIAMRAPELKARKKRVRSLTKGKK